MKKKEKKRKRKKKKVMTQGIIRRGGRKTLYWPHYRLFNTMTKSRWFKVILVINNGCIQGNLNSFGASDISARILSFRIIEISFCPFLYSFPTEHKISSDISFAAHLREFASALMENCAYAYSRDIASHYKKCSP